MENERLILLGFCLLVIKTNSAPPLLLAQIILSLRLDAGPQLP